jgi:hypothetical protein
MHQVNVCGTMALVPEVPQYRPYIHTDEQISRKPGSSGNSVKAAGGIVLYLSKHTNIVNNVRRNYRKANLSL